MGLSGPDENAVVLRRRDGLAETRCCHRSWPLWARNGHAKPGFQEPLTLILGQAPRSSTSVCGRGGVRKNHSLCHIVAAFPSRAFAAASFPPAVS